MLYNTEKSSIINGFIIFEKLIYESINNSSTKKLQFNDICDYIMSKYAYFKSTDYDWKVNII